MSISASSLNVSMTLGPLLAYLARDAASFDHLVSAGEQRRWHELG
jgi:hypothetical protein